MTDFGSGGLPSFVFSTTPAANDALSELSGDRDDGTSALQSLVGKLPKLFEADRAYLGRLSEDGIRFTITQVAAGLGTAELLGYTQSVARLPAFFRGALKSGLQVQIDDAERFPFTPQQRKMLLYEGIGGSVVTPLMQSGLPLGALVVDRMGKPQEWESRILSELRTMADAAAERIRRGEDGSHLYSTADAPSPEAPLLNALAAIARILAGSSDAADATAKVVRIIGDLALTKSVRHLDAEHAAGIVKESLAQEKVVAVRDEIGNFTVGVPLILDGERFGGFEIALSQSRLTAQEDQFLRAVGVFASGAFSNALRRQRPRNESLGDAVTGLLNYRSINEILVEGVHQARMSGRKLTIWMIDIEELDQINRQHGYAVGDDCVSFVGHAVAQAAQPRGTGGRIRGGSYLCVLPNTDTEEALGAGQTFIDRVTKRGPTHLPKISLSMGVATFPTHAGSYDELLRFARLALYASKRDGRNRVTAPRAGDEGWLRDARAAFVKIMTEQDLPPTDRPRRSSYSS